MRNEAARGWFRRTLGLDEFALLDTSFDGLVELDIKGAWGRGDLIVAAHIFLECLTAVHDSVSPVLSSIMKHCCVALTRHGRPATRPQTATRGKNNNNNNTTEHDIPASGAIFELKSKSRQSQKIRKSQRDTRPSRADSVSRCR